MFEKLGNKFSKKTFQKISKYKIEEKITNVANNSERIFRPNTLPHGNRKAQESGGIA